MLVAPRELFAPYWERLDKPRLNAAWNNLVPDWRLNYSIISIDCPQLEAELHTWRSVLGAVLAPCRLSILELTALRKAGASASAVCAANAFTTFANCLLTALAAPGAPAGHVRVTCSWSQFGARIKVGDPDWDVRLDPAREPISEAFDALTTVISSWLAGLESFQMALVVPAPQ